MAAAEGTVKTPSLRAKLLEEADKHLGEKMVVYAIVDVESNTHGLDVDHREYMFKGRSKEEAVVALLDFFGEHSTCSGPHDFYSDLVDDDSADSGSWQNLFECNWEPGMWLHETREDRRTYSASNLPQSALKTEPAVVKRPTRERASDSRAECRVPELPRSA